jgi:aminoglycoside phosphotransferase family enzyme/predicted kinase
MNPAPQAEVISFLSDSSAYAEVSSGVERHETHGAIVFLAGDRAYKLKRAVRFPYMDYSTVEARHKMCLRELDVNRRMAPEIYIGIAKIARMVDGSLYLTDGSTQENAVDWLVVMRRFPQDALLENMRRQGTLTNDVLQNAARRVARFHGASEIRCEMGGHKGVSSVIEGNLGILRQMAGEPFSQPEIALLGELSRAELEKLRGVLERRRRNGYVRQVHGDLHLNNICMIHGEPVPFDAIEFRDEFSQIDLFYDLAFLLMDLDRHGLCEGSNTVLNTYLEETLDYTGLAPLPLYLSCRAAIRAHVTMSMAQKDVNAQMARQDAMAFLNRAVEYLRPVYPSLIAVGGPSGTGKSTLARRLAPAIGAAPGAVILRSDVIRKQLWGLPPTERLPEAAYTAEFSTRVFQAIAERAEIILRTGHSVVADAVYGRPEERLALAKVAERAHAAFLGLWLNAPENILEHRISSRKNDASDATVSVLHGQLKRILPAHDWANIEAAVAPDDMLLQALRHLRKGANRRN